MTRAMESYTTKAKHIYDKSGGMIYDKIYDKS